MRCCLFLLLLLLVIIMVNANDNGGKWRMFDIGQHSTVICDD